MTRNRSADPGGPHLSLALPSTWRRRTDLDHGVLLHACARALPASGVRPELVVRCEPVDPPGAGPEELAGWRAGAMAQLAARLDDFDLEDEEQIDLDGRAVAYHRFAHRSPTTDLVSEQWAWLYAGLGTVLTGTVAREDYPDWFEVFEAIAQTLDPPG